VQRIADRVRDNRLTGINGDALLAWILCPLAVVGHFAICVAVLNRLHSFALRRWLRHVVDAVVFAVLLGVLGLAEAALMLSPESFQRPLGSLAAHPVAAAYFALCCVYAVLVSWLWAVRKYRGPAPQLLSNHSRVIRADRQFDRLPCGDLWTRMWARVPGNQLLHLEVNEKTLHVPRLPAELDGLRIAHLSDLHFTGQLTRDYFDVIVDQTNAMQADLIAITGDLIDRHECLPWFHQVLGRLSSRLGVFCVLGNHEWKLPDKHEIVDAIQSAGLHYVGGACTTVGCGGQTILLAGNELPWWGPAANVQRHEAQGSNPPALRVLLAHTPDRIRWARQHGFDLMLAGHTHGGQIRFPMIGAVVSQSRYGVKYASGVFYEPPSVLHVSRGLSGCQPLRILCRPELALLVLRSSSLMLP
jgi:uncharacterized protein